MKLFLSVLLIFILSLVIAVFLTVGSYVLGFTALIQGMVFIVSFFGLAILACIVAGDHLSSDDEYGLYN